MKWIATTLVFFLAPTLNAQKMGPGNPRQPSDLSGGPSFTWVDMFPTRPAPAPHAAQPVKPISVHELLIPQKAIKELQRSRKAFDSGDYRASNEHLEKALRIYPDIPQAHYDLGGNFVRLHENEKALAEFQKALEVDPDLSQAHQGLAVALFDLKRYREAEASARRALELDPDSIDYRYMLARSIIAQGYSTPELKGLLHRSSAKFPGASLVLAEIFLNEGKVDDVVSELQSYLSTPEPKNRAAAECWIALLNGSARGDCAAQKAFPEFR